MERREVFGDELIRILDGVGLEKPEIDLGKEETWPKMSSRSHRRRRSCGSRRRAATGRASLVPPPLRDLYVALAAIVGAGVGAFVVLATRSAPPEAAAWSSWEPTGSRLARVRQIADRIPKAYKQPNGEQLTVTQRASSRFRIPAGQATRRSLDLRPSRRVSRPRRGERHRLLRRRGRGCVRTLWPGIRRALRDERGDLQRALHAAEPSALELSLYTFKYVKDVNSVIVFLPPSPEGQSDGSMFFRRGDVSDELRLRSLTFCRRANRASSQSATSSSATSRD